MKTFKFTDDWEIGGKLATEDGNDVALEGELFVRASEVAALSGCDIAYQEVWEKARDLQSEMDVLHEEIERRKQYAETWHRAAKAIEVSRANLLKMIAEGKVVSAFKMPVDIEQFKALWPCELYQFEEEILVVHSPKAERDWAKEMREIAQAPDYDYLENPYNWFIWNCEHKARPIGKRQRCDVLLTDGKLLFDQSPHDFNWTGDQVFAARQC